MTDRRKVAKNAALEATELAGLLVQLSNLENWHKTRLNATDKVAQKLTTLLNSLKGLEDKEEVKQAKPIDLYSMPGAVFIPVDGYIGTSPGGARRYAMKGFVGDPYIDKKGNRRINKGSRYYPREIIMEAYDARVGGLWVELLWFNKPNQANLREWVKSRVGERDYQAYDPVLDAY
jgi:hypothetical protein